MLDNEIILDVQHLQKKFGKFQALTDVNLTLHKGEVLGLIGPNGAGKSTTIRTILGLIKKSGGSVEVFGFDAWKKSVRIHEDIAYVPGEVYLWPNLTGGETIDLLLKASRQRRSQRTENLIKKFGLDTSKKNRTYSKGNRQKIALIVALSLDTDLYIFDEPTSGMDILNEQMFQEEIQKLKGEGKSILLSSHILSEYENIVDIVSVINDGKTIETGTLESLKNLTSNQVDVTTIKPLNDLAEQLGVSKIVFNANKTKASFTLDYQDTGNVMKYLVENEIIDLTIMPPTLETLFLKYYENNSKSR